mgnify:CR=1 FL=1|tara:strand:+ start:324 stop:671 length:348 start_codon:yes stop_codon:yes gene_type:complete
MATIRFIDSMDVEAQKSAKCLTIRERQVIRNLLADTVGKNTSTLISQINSYFEFREDSQFQGASIIQDDKNWLKVKLHVGNPGCTAFNKVTSYQFKIRHPENPVPTKFSHLRNNN